MTLLQRLRRFGIAKKGLAALEFAILAPMMVFLLFGSVDLLDMLSANRRAQNVVASLADVVARDNSVSSTEVNSLWAAQGVLMYPTTGDAMKVRLSSISIENSSTARVVWSRGNGLAARNTGSTVSLPSAMMRPGTSLIMAESEFTFVAPLGFLMSGPTTMRHNAYRRSRLVDPIPCTWNGCS
ncbi:MAG: TadE/TadG family type IV pilus assembly protein [Hyphomonadaceae bacterium]